MLQCEKKKKKKKQDLDNSEALVNYGLCFTASKTNVFIKKFWGLILKHFPQKAYVFQAELLADEGSDFITVYSINVVLLQWC